MDLFDAAFKSEVTRVMGDIFDSFSRSVTVVFHQSETNTVTVFDPAYNADFMESEAFTSISKTSQSQSFSCRIWYLDRQPYSTFVEGGDDLGVKGKFYYNRVRIQFQAAAFEYLKDTERFMILDEKYQIEEGWQRIGALQDFEVYEVVLQRVN